METSIRHHAAMASDRADARAESDRLPVSVAFPLIIGVSGLLWAGIWFAIRAVIG